MSLSTVQTTERVETLQRRVNEIERQLQMLDVLLTRFRLHERSVDPADPKEGNMVLWMSDGTGAGDDGDVLVKINVGGTVKTATIVDYSAV